MKAILVLLSLICLTTAYRPNMRQRVLELHANTDDEEIAAEQAADNPRNLTNMTDLEKYGYYLEEPDFLAKLFSSVQSLFVTENEPILSNKNEEVSCYTLDNAKCNFKAEEQPVVFVIEYDQEPGEYSMSVKDEDDDIIMKRRLKTSNCEDFNNVMNLFDRELFCELRDYAHVISIKHIG